MARLLLATTLLAGAITAPAEAVFAQGNTSETARNVREGKRPKLVVVLSIDQFRGDYIRRLVDLFLPADAGKGQVGGFRYLMTAGSDFLDARHMHYPTFTGPGHSVQLTGTYPYKTGIAGNEWWDKEKKAKVYCVDDPRQKVVGAASTSKATPMGPLNLHATTIGDELKLATANRAKVVSISLKDRASILMGGHMQNVALWFDTDGGRWISSTAYCKDGKLPAWVEQLNGEGLPAKSFGKTWTPIASSEALTTRAFSPQLPEAANPSGIGRAFPHSVPNGSYGGFTLTPWANEFVFETAKRAVTSEKLGQREGFPTDLLTINLATNDYVGHAFGPYSPEALDTTLQTDRQLSNFLNFLNGTVPGGLKNVVFVLTADHGVAPVPEDSVRFNLLPEGRTNAGKVVPAAVQKALSDRFGEDTWIAQSADGKENGGFIENFVYLNDDAIAKALASGKATSRAQIEQVGADAITGLHLLGYYHVYTRTQILNGALPDTNISRYLMKGFHPRLTGDLVLVDDEDHLTGGSSGTSHGTPYAYDAHVPLIFCGFGIAPGVWSDPVSVADLAPTLSVLLGIEFPSGSEGTILKPALK